jgi:hypothetical protein
MAAFEIINLRLKEKNKEFGKIVSSTADNKAEAKLKKEQLNTVEIFLKESEIELSKNKAHVKKLTQELDADKMTDKNHTKALLDATKKSNQLEKDIISHIKSEAESQDILSTKIEYGDSFFFFKTLSAKVILYRF